MSDYDPQKLAILADLRRQAGFSQSQIAEYFDLKSRDSVSSWELGYRRPHRSRRSHFIVYLLDKLGLRRDYQRFFEIWGDVMEEEWGWEELSDNEVWEYFPGTAKQKIAEKRNVPFLAPPRPFYDLVGRDDLLRRLKEQLFAGKSVAISALNGLPGVGKTALAVEFAHEREVLRHFRDGVLWVGLGRQPDTLSLLGTWCTALGLESDEIAKLTSVEDRARAIYSSVGLRRMLLVVDDAWQIESALAFRVGGPNCAHLVTTRLPEIALRFAGKETTVSELDEADGLMLLAQLAPAAVGVEPHDARELVRIVGGLPLALILMGNFLRVEAYSGQQPRLRSALNRLHQAEKRLHIAEPQAPIERHPSLPKGARISLQAVIKISYDELDDVSQHTLEALSVFPPKPNTFSEEAALAVSDAQKRALNSLVEHGLLEGSVPGRYTLHQTIVDYARARSIKETAYERMAEFFVEYVEAHKSDYDELDLETSNIIASLDVASERGMHATLVRGAGAFCRFLETRGLYDLAEVYLDRAQRAANHMGDPIAFTTVLLNRGRIMDRRGEYDRAEGLFQQGLAVARECRDSSSVSASLQNLGSLATKRGDYEQAEAYLLEGLDLARKSGDVRNICTVLQSLGAAARRYRDYARAEAYLLEGLGFAREIGDPDIISALLTNLGVVADDRGDYAQAEVCLLEGLELAREIGHRQRISVLLANLGGVADSRGDYAQAEAYLLEGLELARELRYRQRISVLLQNLGAVAANLGDPTRAEVYFQEGLALAREIGHRERICYLLVNLGVVAADQGDYAQAEAYFGESLDLAREMEHRLLTSITHSKRGELHLKQLDWDSAFTDFSEAHETAQEIGSQDRVALALFGLAQVAVAQDDPVRAQGLGRESLAILENIGHSKASQVKTWLAEWS